MLFEVQNELSKHKHGDNYHIVLSVITISYQDSRNDANKTQHLDIIIDINIKSNKHAVLELHKKSHVSRNKMLKNLLKNTLTTAFNASALQRVVHKTLLRNRLVIICYHIIARSPFSFPDWCILDVDSFKRQLRYLKSHFDLLPLREAVEKCRKNALHRPTAVITFDDGYQNNYDTAFPILKDLGIPATIFLTTALVDTDNSLWFCRINMALAQCSLEDFSWKGARIDLRTAAAKASASKSLQASLKQLPHQELLEEAMRIVEGLGDDPSRPFERHSLFRMLDTRSIKDMLNSGLISFGAHTHSHAIVSLLSEEEQQVQISRSLDTVRELTGEPCKVFAYPNGRRQDYGKETIGILHKCGVDMAVTGIDGHNRSNTRPLELRRIGIGGTWKPGYFPIAVHPHPGVIRW